MDLLTHMVKLFQCRKFKSNDNLNKPLEDDKHGFFFVCVCGDVFCSNIDNKSNLHTNVYACYIFLFILWE